MRWFLSLYAALINPGEPLANHDADDEASIRADRSRLLSRKPKQLTPPLLRPRPVFKHPTRRNALNCENSNLGRSIRVGQGQGEIR